MIYKCEIYLNDFSNIMKFSFHKNNTYHRLSGPALKWTNGDEYWFKEGDLHRESNPAVTIILKNVKLWYENNILIK